MSVSAGIPDFRSPKTGTFQTMVVLSYKDTHAELQVSTRTSQS
jgi:NAD-dependent SIR2 family protein deacetylase